jgi:hypothetical protein
MSTVANISIPILGIELESYDNAVKDNPQYVTEFIKDIEKHLKANEVTLSVNLACKSSKAWLLHNAN